MKKTKTETNPHLVMTEVKKMRSPLRVYVVIMTKHLYEGEGLLFIVESWSWQRFFVKGQIVNVFRFADHRVSVPTTQPCHWSIKGAIEDMYINKHGYVPIKHHFQKQPAEWIWPLVC